MSSSPEKGKVSWRDLPKLSFSRSAGSSAAKKARSDVAHGVRSAETLGAEFDNRKLSFISPPKRNR